MKKPFCCLIVCLLLCACAVQMPQPAHAAETVYARIQSDTVMLYKSAQENESIDNKWCYLPQTFFVKILTTYNELFYKVEFMSLTGYVKKQEVSLVMETPKNPYPSTTTFSIAVSGCYLRSSPKVKGAVSNVLVVLPTNAKITYLGKMIGEEGVDLQGSIWYLGQYNDIVGYVFSSYTDTFLPVQTNTEITTQRLTTAASVLNPLTNTESLLFLSVMMLPILLILWLLYHPKPQKACAPKTDKTPSNQLEGTNQFHDNEL